MGVWEEAGEEGLKRRGRGRHREGIGSRKGEELRTMLDFGAGGVELVENFQSL